MSPDAAERYLIREVAGKCPAAYKLLVRHRRRTGGDPPVVCPGCYSVDTLGIASTQVHAAQAPGWTLTVVVACTGCELHRVSYKLPSAFNIQGYRWDNGAFGLDPMEIINPFAVNDLKLSFAPVGPPG